MSKEFEYETELVRIAGELLLGITPFDGARRDATLELLRQAYKGLSPSRRGALRKAAELDPGRAPPPGLIEHLRRDLGITGLHRWADERAPKELALLGSDGALSHWLVKPPLPPDPDLLKAGLRYAVGLTPANDASVIDAQLGRLLRRETMLATYTFDPRALPTGFVTDSLEGFVKAELDKTVRDLTDPMTFFVFGAMSLDGFMTQDSTSQKRHVRDLRFESEGTTKGLDGVTDRLNRDSYSKIADQIDAIRMNGGPGSAYYEEVAFVSRQLIGNAVAVPIDANGLRERVAQALNDYVPGQSGGTLSIPDLSQVHGVTSDLVKNNIAAFGPVYAASCLEDSNLWRVLDRVVEVFMNAQLPIGFDNGGRALAEYFFEDHDKRLNEAARRMTYTRVLGVPGGEVSKEAPPNRAFQDLFLRFMANVSEFDRQRRIGDVVGGRPRNDALSLTGEQVRKSGRDLAANASLYGYGGTFFIAQRLAKQIEQALRILSVPEILAAYGVQGPFQVIERVCASDFGGVVPNLVRNRTMAEAGKGILDIVAANVPAWIGQSGRDLFEDPFDAGRGEADIPAETQQRLMRFVEHWLAVNGIKDDQRARLGEPEMSSPVASIPTSGGHEAPAFDQLRQMISSGQTPSLDQLKTLVPNMGGAVRV